MTVALSKSRALMGCASSLTLMAAMFASQQVAAHGYMSDPPSRAYACVKKLNTDCGTAVYEPQSVGETNKGFPTFGPADGQIASGGLSQFFAIDAQSATRWHLSEITDRNVQFDWYYEAAHKTTKWEYFITKAGWNPNLPLARASFDLTPFCTVEAGGAVPVDGAEGSRGPAKEKHECVIPADRTGQHIILGAWTVDNTVAAFYNVVDVIFSPLHLIRMAGQMWVLWRLAWPSCLATRSRLVPLLAVQKVPNTASASVLIRQKKVSLQTGLSNWLKA